MGDFVSDWEGDVVEGGVVLEESSPSTQIITLGKVGVGWIDVEGWFVTFSGMRVGLAVAVPLTAAVALLRSSQ